MRSDHHAAAIGGFSLFRAAGVGFQPLAASGRALPAPGAQPRPLPSPEQVCSLVLAAPATVEAWSRVLEAKAAGDDAGVDWYDLEQPTPEAAVGVLAMLRTARVYRDAVTGVLARLQFDWMVQGHSLQACRERAQQGAVLLDQELDRRVDAMLDPQVAG